MDGRLHGWVSGFWLWCKGFFYDYLLHLELLAIVSIVDGDDLKIF
jgi:hypothetical protein